MRVGMALDHLEQRSEEVEVRRVRDPAVARFSGLAPRIASGQLFRQFEVRCMRPPTSVSVSVFLFLPSAKDR